MQAFRDLTLLWWVAWPPSPTSPTYNNQWGSSWGRWRAKSVGPRIGGDGGPNLWVPELGDIGLEGVLDKFSLVSRCRVLLEGKVYFQQAGNLIHPGRDHILQHIQVHRLVDLLIGLEEAGRHHVAVTAHDTKTMIEEGCLVVKVAGMSAGPMQIHRSFLGWWSTQYPRSILTALDTVTAEMLHFLARTDMGVPGEALIDFLRPARNWEARIQSVLGWCSFCLVSPLARSSLWPCKQSACCTSGGLWWWHCCGPHSRVRWRHLFWLVSCCCCGRETFSVTQVENKNPTYHLTLLNAKSWSPLMIWMTLKFVTIYLSDPVDPCVPSK